MKKVFRITQKEIVQHCLDAILGGCACGCDDAPKPEDLCLHCWAQIYMDHHPDWEHIAHKGVLVRRKSK